MIKHIKSIVLDTTTVGFLFGVVLYLILQPTEDQILDLKFIGILSLACASAGVLFSLTAIKLGYKTLGCQVFESKHIKTSPIPWHRTLSGWQLVISFLVAMTVGIIVTESSLTELRDEAGFTGAMRIFSSFLDPEMGILPRALLAIFQTIFIAFTATVMALPFSFAMSFLCAKNIMGAKPTTFSIYFVLRTISNVFRSIEPLIWAIIFSVWVGIGPFSGMLALFIHSVVSLAKQYSEIIEGVNDGPIEGILSTGAGPLQVIWFAIVPQIVLPFVSFTIFRWDINVRMATVIGMVGGGGIGTMINQYQGQAMWREVGCLMLVVSIVVWAMDAASAYLREALK